MSVILGDSLIKAGLLSKNQLHQAVSRRRQTQERLATSCLNLGLADETSLASILSQLQGIPYVVISKSKIPLELIQYLSIEMAQSLNALPVMRSADELVVAMADPANPTHLDELRFITGARIVEHGALMGPLHDAIESSYLLCQAGKARYYQGRDLDSSIRNKPWGHLEVVIGKKGSVASSSTLSVGFETAPQFKANLQWAKPMASTQPKSSQTQQPFIMVVDDDETLRNMLVKFLNKSGFQTLSVGDGRKALESLQTTLPDAIVLDAMLPGVHGFEICRRIKNAQATQHIPVVMISAIYRGGTYSEQVRLHYGANAYIEKPLKLTFLKQVLDNCLSVQPKSPKPSSKTLTQKVSKLLEESIHAYQHGDLTQSAELMNSAITLAPFFSSIHHKLALVYFEMGKTYRAISQMEQAAELKPSYSIFLHLAELYEHAGFIQKAVETYNQSIKSCSNQDDIQKIREHVKKLV